MIIGSRPKAVKRAAGRWVDTYRQSVHPSGLAVVNYSAVHISVQAGIDPGLGFDRDADSLANFNRLLWCGVVGNTGSGPQWVQAPGGAMNAILDEKSTDYEEFEWLDRSCRWDGPNPYVRKPDISAPAAHELKDPLRQRVCPPLSASRQQA